MIERQVKLTIIEAGSGVSEGPNAGERKVDIQYATGAVDREGNALPVKSTFTLYGEVAGVEVSSLVRVEFLGADGALIAERLVGTTQLACCRSLSGASVRVVGVAGVLQLVLATPELDDLLMGLAKRPPIWAILGGFEIGMVFETNSAEHLDDGTARIPARILAAGRPALVGEVLQGPRAFPYLMSAGLVEIRAKHPEREDRRIKLRVIGAERGHGPALFDGAAPPFPAPGPDARLTGPVDLASIRPGNSQTVSGKFDRAPASTPDESGDASRQVPTVDR